MKRSHSVVLVVVIVLIIDQALKFWVKTNMEYGSQFAMLGWDRAYIHFVENPGMAFGIEFGGEYGKLALSLFRIFAVGFLIYLIRQLVQQGAKQGLLVCFGLILAGAIGNIIDSAFYGVIFSSSSYHLPGPAELFPEGGGYAGFLHGRVVDMLYFPLFQGTFPAWLPVWGGQPYLFFRPVFNIADAAISVGVFCLIAFYSSFFRHDPEPQEPASHEVPVTPEVAERTEWTSDNLGKES